MQWKTLAVDLDGTLIRSDMLIETGFAFLKACCRRRLQRLGLEAARADFVPAPPSGLTSLGALVGLSVVPARDAKPPEPSH